MVFDSEKIIGSFNALLKSRVPLFSFIILATLYLYSYVIIPFHDHDSVIYAIRGALIFQGVPIEHLPFDHKPLGLNLIYGLFGYLIQYGHGQSLTIAIFFNSLITIVSYRLISPLLDHDKTKSYQIITALVIFLITFQAPFVGFSGNSETLANFFILVSLYFLFNAIEHSNKILILSSGFIAVLSLSINLLSLVILSLPTLFLLTQFTKERILSFSIYLSGIVLGLLLLILLYTNLGDPKYYLYDLYDFYQVYGDRTQEERLKSFLYFFRSLIIFVPILIASIYFLRKLNNRLTILVYALTLWTLSAFMACLVSGNNLVHYVSFLVAPLVIISTVLSINFDLQKRLLVFFVPIFFCSTYMATEIYDNYRKFNFFQLVMPNMDQLSEVIKDERLLSIQTGHVPFYLSELKPTQKYLFPQNANFFKGSNEDEYWLTMIEKYNYVIIPKDVCFTNSLPLTCLSLNKEFKKEFTSNNLEQLGTLYVRSFIIYQRERK